MGIPSFGYYKHVFLSIIRVDVIDTVNELAHAVIPHPVTRLNRELGRRRDVLVSIGTRSTLARAQVCQSGRHGRVLVMNYCRSTAALLLVFLHHMGD